LVLPVDIRRNMYGNIANRALQRAKGKKDVFVGTVHGIGGFWRRRRGDKLTLLASFKPSATYQPVFHFRGLVATSVARNFPALLRTALARAVATAHR
jgi:hypothetical protein